MSPLQNYRHRAPLTAPDSGRANSTVERSGKTIEEFVDAYIDEYEGTLNTHDAYEASVTDYVDCGTGEP